MSEQFVPNWLKWAREIQALAQSGLMYFSSLYEKERYERLLEISADMLALQAGVAQSTALESFKMQPGYATPKVDVRGAVIRENKILLVQESSDHNWAMPGGWADVGDFPSETVVREVREEAGFDVTAVKIIGVFDGNRDGRPLEFYHAYKIVFLCEIVGGAPKPSYETLDVAFFDFDNLPPLSQSRTNQRHLDEIKSHLKNPNRLAFFD